jgi:hypothetical protein
MLLTETKKLFAEISSKHFNISSSFRSDAPLATIAVLAALKPKNAFPVS